MTPLQAVESRSLTHVGYCPVAKVLSVRFKGKDAKAVKVHQYKDVEPEAHQALMKATSIGAHFAAHIKPHHSHTVLVDEQD